MMTVGELKVILAGYEDDVEVCIGVSDIGVNPENYYEVAGTVFEEARPRHHGLFLTAGEELPPL